MHSSQMSYARGQQPLMQGMPAEKGGSIKVTLQRLEVGAPTPLLILTCVKDMIRAVQEDIAQSKHECQRMRQEKESLECQLTAKSTDSRKNLTNEANR